jgi:hypothetical protein
MGVSTTPIHDSQILAVHANRESEIRDHYRNFFTQSLGNEGLSDDIDLE